MKKLLVCLAAAGLLFASCTPVPDPDTKTPANNTETNDQTSDQQGEDGENANNTPESEKREFKIEGADEYSLWEKSEDGKTITLKTGEGAPKTTEDGKDYKTGYILSGDFEGQIITKGKTTLNLNGVKLTNKDAPAIYAEKKVEIKTEAESTNTITTTGDYVKEAEGAAIFCIKNVEIGGSGTLIVSGTVNHGIKGDEIEIKGSGIITASGASEGSAINCNTFTVGKNKTFTLNLKDSKNGVKADKNIDIASGTFKLSNITKAGFKTDKIADDGEAHHITIEGATVDYSTITDEKFKLTDTDPVTPPAES